MLKRLIIASIFLFAGFFSCQARETLDSLKISGEEEIYIFRLKTGDEITGRILQNDSTEKGRKYIKIESSIGESLIYHDEISDFQPYDAIYKHSHRVFLMPTAEPITEPFIGNLQAVFLYGGFGITQYFSTTFARSVIPILYEGQQITELNMKSTVYQRPLNDSVAGHMSVAGGFNYIQINDDNSFWHYYASITFRLKKTGFTTNLYYKNGGPDVYEVYFKDNVYPVIYESGTFGVGLGIDTKFSDRHNLFYTAEVWNKNIQSLRETGLSSGFRMVIDNCAMEWGLVFFPKPFALPYFNFVWTPFGY
jgi:hypothetical protein